MSTPLPRSMRQVMAAVAANMLAAGDTSKHYFGEEWLADQRDAGGRYVWVPRSDSPGAPFKGGTNPRAIFAFAEGVSIHCWGVVAEKDNPTGDSDLGFDVAWMMRNNVLVALRNTLGSSFRPITPCGWLPKGDRVTHAGRCYVLTVSIDIPVVDETLPTVRIVEIVNQLYADMPDGTEATGPVVTVGSA